MSQIKNINKIVSDLHDQFSEEESKYILKLETNHRPGSSYNWSEDYDIIKGSVNEIVISEYYNYPTHNTQEVLIVPKELGTTLYFKVRADKEMNIPNKDIIYAFTKNGWKSLDINASESRFI
jgi:hypothetical protein